MTPKGQNLAKTLTQLTRQFLSNSSELPEKWATHVMAWWIRPDVLPNDLSIPTDTSQPILYVLESGGLADRVALNLATQQQRLPSPHASVTFCGQQESSRVLIINNDARRLFGIMKPRRTSARLRRLIAAYNQHHQASGAQCLLYPVAIYWGRSPDREDSLWKQIFSENWRGSNRLSKLFKTLLHGRHTLVQFSQPMSLHTILHERQPTDVILRKVSRILRVHYRQSRIATLGPDLSHRRTLISRVVSHESVQALIQTGTADERAAKSKEAERYAYEIAADISYPSVRALQKVLSRLWNRLYDGVELHGIERLKGVADGHELVYVPCHRSHIDYLLLSYILYMQGMSLPHIAAGNNLDMPIIGSILRRGGAFFLRRSFKDNRLYGSVFNAYLQEMLSRGHALEYFIEGGRSRTGRLLHPKPGMLSMTVQAHFQAPERPVLFVPVYFGYERLVEGGAFASELAGSGKKKETLFGFLKSLKLLREAFGTVHVNIATPISLTELLDNVEPHWQQLASQQSGQQSGQQADKQWLHPVINTLGSEIMQRINAAASVTPVSLVSLAMLSTPHGRMAEDDLLALLTFLQKLHAMAPYSDEVVMTSTAPTECITHAKSLGYLERESHVLGDIIAVRPGQTIPLSFFRNNILHLYALHACVACCFVHQRYMPRQEVCRLVELTYPYLKNELYLSAESVDVHTGIEQCVDDLVTGRVLIEQDGQLMRAHSGTAESFLLVSLAQVVMSSLQRYYLTASVLSRLGNGVVSAKELGDLCATCAQRLELIYGLRSPDFYDQALFKGFINTLEAEARVTVDADEKLTVASDFALVEQDARAILGEDVRRSILNVTAKASQLTQP